MSRIGQFIGATSNNNNCHTFKFGVKDGGGWEIIAKKYEKVWASLKKSQMEHS